MGLHEIIHRVSRERKEEIWELSELWASPKFTDGEEDGYGEVSEVEETKRRSIVPEAREKIIPQGEQSTLLTAAGLNEINYWEVVIEFGHWIWR